MARWMVPCLGGLTEVENVPEIQEPRSISRPVWGLKQGWDRMLSIRATNGKDEKDRQPHLYGGNLCVDH